jgi:HEAT repeat protein
MHRFRLCVVLLLLFSCGAAMPADEAKPGALDVIASDALGAIAIRNVKELTTRGDAMIDKADIKAAMRVSDLYRMGILFLGLSRGVDEEGAAAVMLMSSKPDAQAFVLAVPVADAEAMAGNFKLTAKDFAGGKVVDRREREQGDHFLGPFVRYAALDGQHFYLGGDPKVMQAAIKGKRLSAVLNPQDRATLAEDDLIGYANRQQLDDDGKRMFSDEFKRQLKQFDADEKSPLRQSGDAIEDLDMVVGGLRLDEGLGTTLVLNFKGDKSRAVLTKLQGGKAKAALAGLPAGRVLGAHSSSGDGDASAALLKSLLMAKLPFDEQMFISAAHRPNIVGVFGELWQRLEGSRTAIYENENADRDGLFSLVAILETENAEKFIADMTSLATFVNAATLTGDDAAKAIDEKTIAELIAQLGDEQFRVRQLATTKLGLIGPPALAALAKAEKSPDPEVQFRAAMVRQQIAASLAAQREDLLKHDLLDRIKPQFAYFPKRETRSGRPVDIVQIKMRAEEEEYAPQLQRFLGPDWSKLRLATVGERVIVLLGSDTALLEKAIANVNSGEPGLAADARYAQFQQRSPKDPTATFHLRLARSQELLATEPVKDAAAPTGATSLGITIAPQRLRLDLFAPYSEVKAVVKQLGF